MKVFRFILILICITTVTTYLKGQNFYIDSVLNKMYSSEDLLTDLEFVKEKITTKKFNQTPYLFLSQNRFNDYYDSIRSIITERGNMTLKDFYFLVNPFVKSLCDDHLNFSLFGQWGIENNKPKIFNENVMLADAGIIFQNNIYINVVETYRKKHC